MKLLLAKETCKWNYFATSCHRSALCRNANYEHLPVFAAYFPTISSLLDLGGAHSSVPAAPLPPSFQDLRDFRRGCPPGLLSHTETRDSQCQGFSWVVVRGRDPEARWVTQFCKVGYRTSSSIKAHTLKWQVPRCPQHSWCNVGSVEGRGEAEKERVCSGFGSKIRGFQQ